MKEKYRDQDEEDRELIMKLLGVSCAFPWAVVAPGPSPDPLCHHSLQAPTGRTKGKKGRRGRQKKRQQRNNSRNPNPHVMEGARRAIQQELCTRDRSQAWRSCRRTR